MRTVIALACAAVGAGAFAAPPPACRAHSPATLTPVIEVYTSEGCSSCPPADRWLSSLKADAAQGRLVAQGFHVGYWDSLGWVDRFATPAYTQRQRQAATWNHLATIYTPQVLRDGRDWHSGAVPPSTQPARAGIEMHATGDDAFAATVTPAPGVAAWDAYWTVTEHGHASKVKAGENAGEYLQHDFVVRQYVPAGERQGAATLTLRTIATTPGHPRQINLVVFDPANGATLQALSLACS